MNRHSAAAATSATNGGARAMKGPTDRSRRRYAIGPAGTATVASGCTRIGEMLGPAPRSGRDAPSPGPVRRRGAAMHDGWAVALAVATAVGAWSALPVPRWLGAVAIVAALAARRPALLCLGAALLATALSVAAWAGTAPVPRGTVPRRRHARHRPGDGRARRTGRGARRQPPPRGVGPRRGGRRPRARARQGSASPSSARAARRRPTSAGASPSSTSPGSCKCSGSTTTTTATAPAGPPTGCGAPSWRARGRCRRRSGRCSPASCWATTAPSRPTWSTTSAPPASAT